MSARTAVIERASARHVASFRDALTLARAEVGEHDLVLVFGLPAAAVEGAA